ncbi:MAG: SPFH/Band 7/PHB domain protein [Clostridia bacterium]|nr:SPFH/Band 7/PHB domain protein [Clostridia bacterium]
MNAAEIVLMVLGIVILAVLVTGIRVVRQATAVTVERLGKYRKTLETGVHYVLPIFDKTSRPISLKEIVADFKPQPVITKDNVTMQIDTVVYFQITDAKLYTYGVDKPLSAIENLTATTLRNIVGELELDETLTSRDTVNSKMRIILDEATDPWGIKINRVELKNILPPKDIQEAMEKQMRAERERREAILRAEGEKKSNILVAEGEKQAKILRAEADKESKILAAEAEKAALIAEAEGKATAVDLINKANPNSAYITLEGFRALIELSKGESTKIIIPSELQNLTATLAALKEGVTDSKKK